MDCFRRPGDYHPELSQDIVFGAGRQAHRSLNLKLAEMARRDGCQYSALGVLTLSPDATMQV